MAVLYSFVLIYWFLSSKILGGCCLVLFGLGSYFLNTNNGRKRIPLDTTSTYLVQIPVQNPPVIVRVGILHTLLLTSQFSAFVGQGYSGGTSGKLLMVMHRKTSSEWEN